MNGNQVINVDRALDEKKAMQKIFIHDNGYESSVLALLIEHFEGEIGKHEKG